MRPMDIRIADPLVTTQTSRHPGITPPPRISTPATRSPRITFRSPRITAPRLNACRKNKQQPDQSPNNKWQAPNLDHEYKSPDPRDLYPYNDTPRFHGIKSSCTCLTAAIS